ncbi:DUF6042 family protein [Streptomyces lancefieldiae]|uniref:DUF6042 family protein n=1 Tax=Streptomyces lancefieldiae TaxID=3075520 RepID=A0ABU3AWD7_9ACTN|nr:DUF6042 family protein [Streptomyces sp. DSM 40712]MDT0614469.1 DUF6042 family protein [Streptomyces sp. DSM 40712]
MAIANARRVLDATRARRDRDRALGLLPEQVEFMLRRLEREQREQPATDRPPEDALLLFCAGGLRDSDDDATYTSLRKLEQATGHGAEDLRTALHRLATAGEMRLYHGNPETLVSATDLAVRASFVIVADWRRINGNRPRPT